MVPLKRSFPILVAIASLAVCSSAFADSVTYGNIAGGPGLSAAATFTVTGTTLTIVLKNTSTTNVTQPTEVLLGLFWNSTSSATLGGGDVGRGTAVVSAGSTTVNGGYAPGNFGNNISSEWAFSSNVPAADGINAPAKFGVGGSGFSNGSGSWFGSGDTMSIDPANRLNPTNSGPPDGVGAGIVNSTYVTGGGNTGVTGQTEVNNSITFTFTLSSTFSVKDSIDKVYFTYGTSAGEVPPVVGNPPPVGSGPSTPLPSSVWAGGALMAGLATMAKYRRRKIA